MTSILVHNQEELDLDTKMLFFGIEVGDRNTSAPEMIKICQVTVYDHFCVFGIQIER